MKAARYYEAGSPLRIEEADIPRIGPSEVLVKIKASGVCHTDLHFIDGVLKPWKGRPPITLGHEVSGEVAEVGEKARDFAVGDRVVLSNLISCGICRYCKIGRENLCANLDQCGFTVDGGYAEFIKTLERNLVRLPSQVSFEEGSILACGAASVYHGIVNITRLTADMSVVVNGCGGLGFNAIQIAKHMGCKVIAVDISEEKLEMTRKLGADLAVNPNTGDLEKVVKTFTGGMGADVVIELVGSARSMEGAMKILGKMGKYLLIGYGETSLTTSPLTLIVNEIEVLGSVAYTRRDLEAVVQLATSGVLKPIVTVTFPLEEVNRALELLRQGKILGRAAVKP